MLPRVFDSELVVEYDASGSCCSLSWKGKLLMRPEFHPLKRERFKELKQDAT
ncbi:hypothetical protein QQP08_008775 [Theobroma cacao]|nr:hypothetical protein QQP08_008775 [Theobroma cacao]